MAVRVLVIHAEADGPDDAVRLVGVLERATGPGSAALAPADRDAGLAAVERSDVVVALLGPGWRPAAAGDPLAEGLAHAFAHRVPVIAMLMRRTPMPARDALPPPLWPLLDNHPRLTVEMPSDFYWEVTSSHLGRWIRRILDEAGRRERSLGAAAETARKAARELDRTRERLAEARAAVAAAAGRREAAERALAEAAAALEARREEVGEPRPGPGLRVFISHRPETGGDVRTLERDLRERIEGVRLASSEPIPESADPAAIAAGQIARADVVLAVVGPHGAGAAGGAAWAERDQVRLELAAAAARGLPVLPVLTQQAPMPAAAALPESLRMLAAERAYELIHAFWDDGIADIVERLRAIEDGLRAGERALAEALERHRDAERSERDARAGEAQAEAAIRAGEERERALADELGRAGEEEERLRHEPRDTNRAYQDGPGPIALDSATGTALDPRRRLVLGAGALLVIVVIIIIAVSR